MATEITGRNFEVTPDIRELLETKLTKIEDRLIDDVIDVRVVLQVEKYRNICEITIAGRGQEVRVEQESDTSMTDAINAAVDHARRQAQKHREKIRDHHKNDGAILGDAGPRDVSAAQPISDKSTPAKPLADTDRQARR